jgi:hypothetical protein
VNDTANHDHYLIRIHVDNTCLFQKGMKAMRIYIMRWNKDENQYLMVELEGLG